MKKVSLLENILDRVDGFLDNIPCYSEGRWYRYGGWGCRIGILSKYLNRKQK